MMSMLFSIFDPFEMIFSFQILNFLKFFSNIFLFLFFFNSTVILLSLLKTFFMNFFSSLLNSKIKINDQLLFNLFLLMFLINFSSVLGFSFSVSSQISWCMGASFMFWLMYFISNFNLSFMKLFFHFIPEGCPLLLIPVIFLIEVSSFFIRPFTLFIRLFANILAGHLLLSLLSSLVFLSIFSYVGYVILFCVEIFVSIIQSYIFVTLLYLYYSELIN